MSCEDDSCPEEPLNIPVILAAAGAINIFLLIFRILYRKPVPGAKQVSTLKFIIWFEIQFWVVVSFIGSIYGLYQAQLASSATLKYYWNGLTVGIRIPNYVMEWLGLVALDLFLWKAWCVISVGFIVVGFILANIVSFLIMLGIGLYLLGYTQ